MYWLHLILAFGCLISAEICFTTNIDSNVVVIWIFSFLFLNVNSRSLKQQREIPQGEKNALLENEKWNSEERTKFMFIDWYVSYWTHFLVVRKL